MSNIRVVSLATYTSPVVKEMQNKDWVSYGEDNDYFQYLIDRYNGSATNNAIINGMIEMLYGKGLNATDAAMKPDQYAQMKALFDKDCLRKILSDYKMMGQCAMQVVYNDLHDTIVDVEHIPVECLRAEKCNYDSDEIEAYYYAKDWEEVALKREVPTRIAAFGYSDEGNHLEILYIKPYRAGYYYYAPVDYQGGLQYAELEEEIGNFHLNNIKNGLQPSMLLNFNNGIPDEEQRNVIEARIREKFSGSSNAGRFILAFNDNKELAATIDPVQINDAHSQYEFLSEEAQRKLMVAHRVTSPMLLGIKDNTGLGNNAEELETASALFENMVINPMQEVVLDGIKEILSFNDISLDIYFATLNPIKPGDDLKVITEDEAEKKRGFSSHVYLDDEDPCWEGYEMIGFKVKDGMRVPNCVPKEGLSSDMAKLIADRLIMSGEQVSDDEWELIDARPVDYETEEVQNKMWSFAEVIGSSPNEVSEQDTSIIKVRYVYKSTDQAEGDSRDFCRMMINAGKVYRKEDIEDASTANAGFGENGSASYDIFLYKGGPWCQHFWERRTYLRKNNTRISVNEARAMITRLDPSLRNEARIPTNPNEVAKAPRDMKDAGYVNPPWQK
jgi:hypothetical protein